MPVYQLSEDRLDQWKAWLTLNRISTKQVVRNGRIEVNDDGDLVRVVEFYTDQFGKRLLHTCDCESLLTGSPTGHLAKRVGVYGVGELPGEWAAPDLVTP